MTLSPGFRAFCRKFKNLLFLPLGTKKRLRKHFTNLVTSLKPFLKSEATRFTMWLWQVMWMQKRNKQDRASQKAFIMYDTLSELKTQTSPKLMPYSCTVFTTAWDTVLLLVAFKKCVSSKYATELPLGESSSKSNNTAMTSST